MELYSIYTEVPYLVVAVKSHLVELGQRSMDRRYYPSLLACQSFLIGRIQDRPLAWQELGHGRAIGAVLGAVGPWFRRPRPCRLQRPGGGEPGGGEPEAASPAAT